MPHSWTTYASPVRSSPRRLGPCVSSARLVVAAAGLTLDRRERLIVGLRYFGDLSQAEIGAAVGLSQVHVSRVLEAAPGTMTVDLAGTEPPISGTVSRGIGCDRERRQAGRGAQRSSAA